MRKWNGKPTCALAAWVHELRGKTTTTENPSRISLQFLLQFPVDKSPDKTGGPMLLLMHLKYFQFKFVSNKYHDQNWRGPASSKVEERDNCISWIVWMWCLGTQDPQEFKALVETHTRAPCTLMLPRYVGAESISASGVTGDPKSCLYWKVY